MEIERRADLSSREFKRRYFAREQPVVITDAIRKWPARTWKPNDLKTRFGDLPVVAKYLGKGGSAHPDEHYYARDEPTTLRGYFELVESGSTGGSWYIAQQPIDEILPQIAGDIGAFAYGSRLLRKVAGQKTFFWMGSGGCVTPLHFDPLPNFAVQIWGRKRWTIFPRTQHPLLGLPSNLARRHFSPIDVEAPDLGRFPDFARATPITFTLEAGETLFLPAKWPHHVRSLELNISLNFWWTDVKGFATDIPGVYYRRLRDRARKALGLKAVTPNL